MNYYKCRKVTPITNPPLFVFMDFHLEFFSDNKAYSKGDLKKCIEKCRKVLNYARKNRFPIAHFRQNHQGTAIHYKNTASDLVRWFKDFRPMHNEMIFERTFPSCYSSKNFNSYLSKIINPHIILLGLTSTHGCLQTALDAYSRRHDLTFIRDGSATPALGDYSSNDAHLMISEIINIYSRVLTAQEFLEQNHVAQ